MGETYLSQQAPLPPPHSDHVSAQQQPSPLNLNDRERTANELPHRHLAIRHLSADSRFLFPTAGEDVRTHID